MTTQETAGAVESAHRAVSAAWRMDAARIVATLARYTGDFALAEDLAQDAFADALRQWPAEGIPHNPAAWLTTAAKRKAVDGWRRSERYEDRLAQIGQELREDTGDDPPWDPDVIDDDVLRLVFVACHPVLGREAQVALTLRTVAGLETEQIARAFLTPTATVQQRIVRAKRALGDAGVAFETPTRQEWGARLSTVLGVVYLIFTEAHAATDGDEILRPELAREALRLGRMLTALLPREPSPWALLALMELTAARFPARTGADGSPVPLEEQDRRLWDRSAILRGRAALKRADALGRGRGAYALQAAIAEQHAVATDVANTDWDVIVRCYDGLVALSGSPVVALNRAVAVSMRDDPETALALVDELAADRRLAHSHLLPTVRAELLSRLGRREEAAAEFDRAAQLTQNARERAYFLARAARRP